MRQREGASRESRGVHGRGTRGGLVVRGLACTRREGAAAWGLTWAIPDSVFNATPGFSESGIHLASATGKPL